MMVPRIVLCYETVLQVEQSQSVVVSEVSTADFRMSIVSPSVSQFGLRHFICLLQEFDSEVLKNKHNQQQVLHEDTQLEGKICYELVAIACIC